MHGKKNLNNAGLLDCNSITIRAKFPPKIDGAGTILQFFSSDHVTFAVPRARRCHVVVLVHFNLHAEVCAAIDRKSDKLVSQC